MTEELRQLRIKALAAIERLQDQIDRNAHDKDARDELHEWSALVDRIDSKLARGGPITRG